MRIIIAAAGGEDPKWGNYLGVPKHLAPIGGVPLLWHTVEMARQLAPDEVLVTAPAGDPRYLVPGAATVCPEPAPSEYASSRPYWSTAGRTILLLGDVYFTPYAMRTIRDHREWAYRVFGRYGASHITRTRWGEIFAVSFWPQHHAVLDARLAEVHALRAAGTITRPPGWMLLRAMQGTPLDHHRVLTPPFVEINDATDDFDMPPDYDRHPVIRRERAALWQTSSKRS